MPIQQMLLGSGGKVEEVFWLKGLAQRRPRTQNTYRLSDGSGFTSIFADGNSNVYLAEQRSHYQGGHKNKSHVWKLDREGVTEWARYQDAYGLSPQNLVVTKDYVVSGLEGYSSQFFWRVKKSDGANPANNTTSGNYDLGFFYYTNSTAGSNSDNPVHGFSSPLRNDGIDQAKPTSNKLFYGLRGNQNSSSQPRDHGFMMLGADNSSNPQTALKFKGKVVQPNDICFDSSGNRYVLFGGSRRTSGNFQNYSCMLAKFNSSGVKQWHVVIGTNTNAYTQTEVNNKGRNMVFANGSLYLLLRIRQANQNSSDYKRPGIYKVNPSNGALQAEKFLYQNSLSDGTFGTFPSSTYGENKSWTTLNIGADKDGAIYVSTICSGGELDIEVLGASDDPDYMRGPCITKLSSDLSTIVWSRLFVWQFWYNSGNGVRLFQYYADADMYVNDECIYFLTWENDSQLENASQSSGSYLYYTQSAIMKLPLNGNFKNYGSWSSNNNYKGHILTMGYNGSSTKGTALAIINNANSSVDSDAQLGINLSKNGIKIATIPHGSGDNGPTWQVNLGTSSAGAFVYTESESSWNSSYSLNTARSSGSANSQNYNPANYDLKSSSWYSEGYAQTSVTTITP
jgi:hypothetical protein